MEDRKARARRARIVAGEWWAWKAETVGVVVVVVVE
jgi:hypothetical protein